MDEITYTEDTSEIRRQNLKTHLKRGDLKLLAEKLGKNANYLSQLFSFKSKRSISNKLARTIEKTLNMKDGLLDCNPEVVSFEAELKAEEFRVEQELHKVRKSNELSEMALELLQVRLKKILPDAILTMDAHVVFNKHTYTIKILLKNTAGKALLCVETSRSQGGLSKLLSEQSLVMNMSITGAEYGLLAIETNGQLIEKWYQSIAGKVSLINEKPEF
jgi:transcriptional regulator with XRE-family HTH domain